MKHIKPIGLFSTPKDIIEVQDWISKHPQQDQPALSTAAFMTWNLVAGYHNDAVDELQEMIIITFHITRAKDDNGVYIK